MIIELAITSEMSSLMPRVANSATQPWPNYNAILEQDLESGLEKTKDILGDLEERTEILGND
jgi:hypothetical protein